MSSTFTVRLPEDLAQKLEEKARRTGRSRGALVKEALEKEFSPADQPFLDLAGSIDGPPDLSQRKGFGHK